MPSCGDYIMHFLTLPWKLIFAFIPPTGRLTTLTTIIVHMSFITNKDKVHREIMIFVNFVIYLCVLNEY